MSKMTAQEMVKLKRFSELSAKAAKLRMSALANEKEIKRLNNAVKRAWAKNFKLCLTINAMRAEATRIRRKKSKQNSN